MKIIRMFTVGRVVVDDISFEYVKATVNENTEEYLEIRERGMMIYGNGKRAAEPRLGAKRNRHRGGGRKVHPPPPGDGRQGTLGRLTEHYSHSLFPVEFHPYPCAQNLGELLTCKNRKSFLCRFVSD